MESFLIDAKVSVPMYRCAQEIIIQFRVHCQKIGALVAISCCSSKRCKFTAQYCDLILFTMNLSDNNGDRVLNFAKVV